MSSLVSIGTAAKEFGVHPATLRRWEEEGKIDPPERTTGGGRRYDLAKTAPSDPSPSTIV